MLELLLYSFNREKTEACEERPVRGRPEAGASMRVASVIPSHLYSFTAALPATVNSFLPTFQETHLPKGVS